MEKKRGFKNLFITPKKHSYFKKCENLKLENFQIFSKLIQNFKS
jgi:hypothetical protein